MEKSNWNLLINPFYKIAGWKAAAIGLAVILATVALGYLSNTVFYGISIKLVSEITFGRALSLCFIGVACYVAVMYLVALLFAKGVRFQDIFGTVALARWPNIFAALPGFFIPASAKQLIEGMRSNPGLLMENPAAMLS